jgi:phage repressor protein C with HTH and peptisase S24 domain
MKSETRNSWDKRFRERFKAVIERIGTLEKVGSLVGTTGEQVGKWRDERAKAPFLAIAILAREAEVNPLWLAFGEEFGESSNALGFHETEQAHFEHDDAVMLPVLNVTAAAGPGHWNERADVVARFPFSRAYLRHLGIDPEHVHCIRARGDSMWPTIADGAMMLVNARERSIVGDYIWSLVVGDEARVKRVQKLLDGSLSLLSDNKDRYPIERIDASDLDRVEIVGRVFWTEKVL